MDSKKHDRVTNMSLVYNILIINIIICLIFSIIYYVIKSEDNFNGLDNESSFIDCLYFSLTTASSVGYGDISPKSQLAKVFVMFQQLCVIINLSQIAINWGTIETLEYQESEELKKDIHDINSYFKTYLVSNIPNQPVVGSAVPIGYTQNELNIPQDNMNIQQQMGQQYIPQNNMNIQQQMGQQYIPQNQERI